MGIDVFDRSKHGTGHRCGVAGLRELGLVVLLFDVGNDDAQKLDATKLREHGVNNGCYI